MAIINNHPRICPKDINYLLINIQLKGIKIYDAFLLRSLCDSFNTIPDSQAKSIPIACAIWTFLWDGIICIVQKNEDRLCSATKSFTIYFWDYRSSTMTTRDSQPHFVFARAFFDATSLLSIVRRPCLS